jgi:CHASE3 domain sensor protein
MLKTIKSKILSIFIILIVVLGVNCIWAVVNFQRLSQSIENIMQANYRSIVDAQNMSIALERQDSAELSYILTRSKLSVDVFRGNETEFLGWLSKAQDNITEPGEKEILDKINTQYNEYIEKFFTLNEMQNSKKLGDIQEYYYKDIFPLFESVKNECRNLLLLNQNAMLERKISHIG